MVGGSVTCESEKDDPPVRITRSRKNRKRKCRNESEKSSSEEESTDASQLDEEEYQHRRELVINEISNLEKQFEQLKDEFYKERLKQIDKPLQQIKDETAEEYIRPMSVIQNTYDTRLIVGNILRQLLIEASDKSHLCEVQQIRQTYENEKLGLYESIKNDIESRIRQLDIDRNCADFFSDIFEIQSKRSTKGLPGTKRKKPVLVSGPYIVYMLRDYEIHDDWTQIKRERTLQQKRKAEVRSAKKSTQKVQFEDGKLYYDGQWFPKGSQVKIDCQDQKQLPLHCQILSVNSNEVCLRAKDGSRSRWSLHQLQKGQYTISSTMF